jgi:hypothetical protein
MEAFKNNAITAFQEFANKHGLFVHKGLGAYIEILGIEIGLRARWQIDRIEGIFVTLFRKSEPNSEFSITYLVEYLEGAQEDIETSMMNNSAKLIELVEKYALAVLINNSFNFASFEAYAKRRIAEQTPETPEIRATNLIRPEWL